MDARIQWLTLFVALLNIQMHLGAPGQLPQPIVNADGTFSNPFDLRVTVSQKVKSCAFGVAIAAFNQKYPNPPTQVCITSS